MTTRSSASVTRASVAVDTARVNVQVFLRHADDGPAASVDLDVLVRPRTPPESPTIGCGGFLPTATSQSPPVEEDRKSTRLNSSHDQISYAVFCLKKKNK